jgi:lipid-A-disaccharide synthase
LTNFYTGHPLVDFIQSFKILSKNNLLNSLNLKEGPQYIALLPGSRSMEIKYILPLLIEVAERLNKSCPQAHFLIPIATPLLADKIMTSLKTVTFPFTTFERKSPEVIALSDLVILASGSVALEAAIMEKPMILTYKMNPIDAALIKKLIKLKWVGLPNLIAKREIIPELLLENATPENICNLALELLNDEQKRNNMLSDLKELNKILGEPGVVSRIARHIGEKFL